MVPDIAVPRRTPMVVLENVGRIFDRGRIVALRSVTLSIGAHELIGVHGPSGSGKSTLCNMISGIDQPSIGTVAFEGRISPSPREWAELRRHRIGLIFQDFNLLPTLTALENVEVATFGVLQRAADRRRVALDRLAEIDAAYCAARRPQELSGGERRRVAIARALANNPELLLADEPTGNLDTGTGAKVFELLLELHRNRGMVLVVITHDRGFIARCSRRIRMVDGGIAVDERTAEAIAV